MSDRRLRQVFANSPVGMVFVALDRKILEANAVAARMFGYEADAVVGREISEFVHPDEMAETTEFERRLRAGEATGEPRQKRLLRRDGTVVTVRTTAVVVTDEESGVPLYLAAFLEDLTAITSAMDVISSQRERLELTLEAAEMTAWELDLATGVYIVSDNINTVCGIDPLQTPMTFPEFVDRVHPDDLPRFLSPADPTMDTGERFTIDFRFRDDMGVHRWFRSQGRVALDQHGAPLTIRGTLVDITGLRAVDDRERRQGQLYRHMIQASRDAFVAVDGDDRIIEWNRAAEALFGWSPAEAIGRPLVETVISPVSSVATLPTLSGRVLLTGRHRAGHDFPIEASVIVDEDGDAEDESVVRAFIRDITERVAREQELAELALVDGLTGLPNRTLLLDRVDRALARLRQSGSPLAVLFIDIDGFKVVNDSLGHAAGDDLLVAVADRMTDGLRPADTLARVGGDEFVVLCEDLELNETIEIAQRLVGSYSETFRAGGRRHHVTASIGIRFVPEIGVDVPAEDVLRDADTAMCRAKAQCRGHFEVFDDEMRATAMARMELDHDLHRAVDEDEFVVAYQPVVSIIDERVVGLEALVRWNHPQRGLLPPGQFIAAAEANGLIRPIGLKVLARACRQLAAWRARGQADLCMAVNLSGAQLTQADLPDQVARILETHDLPPGNLSLEITESMLMAESNVAATAALGRLHDLGVTLAVDDFGTGYSSLLYLRQFPIDILKLDRAFVSGIAENDKDRSIVGSTIELAHSLDLLAIAEGVETQEQLRALQDLGCDLAQGFYWSRAQFPGVGLEELFDQRPPMPGQ